MNNNNCLKEIVEFSFGIIINLKDEIIYHIKEKLLQKVREMKDE